LSGKADDAEQKDRVRQVIHQPRGGEPRHPVAHHRDGLAEEVELEVAVTQGPPCVGDAAHCGSLSLRRLMISPAANRVSRSRSLSCAKHCASQVFLASPTLFCVASPLAVSAMFTWRPSVAWGFRLTMPSCSSVARMGRMDCGLMPCARASSA